MSDSEHSTATYTSISSDYEEPSDVGSLGVVVYGYDRLPMHPPSPDYVPGPEHPPSPNYVPGPEHPLSLVYVPYVLEPAYPEFMPPEDDVFPAEEQPLPAAISATTDLPGEGFFEDDADDEDEDESEDEEEKEEHLALADSVLPPAYRITARIASIAMIRALAPSTLEGVNQRVTDLVTTVRQDTDEIYERLDDTQDDRSLMSGQLNLLRRDRRSHARMTRLTQMVALQSQQRPTRDPAHPDVPEEAGTPKKRTTRASPGTTTTTTPVTNAQLKALIDQGISDALAARDTDRSRNGDDSHNSGTSSKRTEQTACECAYTDFLKCQPMNFKGTEAVVGLT
ncbi:hypothetical protein Tco_0628139 [Tanacetum coccineum]|uniref:Uncharacterized protein n=1 Tax=Tanacetum coccineum TaxID=301880 RepID=A0ABQ4WPH6_9ASTR